MSLTDKSVQYVGENLGDDPSEATSKSLGSPLPPYIVGRRWSLRQVACRLLYESLVEEGDEEEEDSFPCRMGPIPKEERTLFGNHGSRPVSRPGLPAVSGNRTFTC
ncbi:UNVERIFIED_CONTAM: hypothetical protein Sradi_4300300 [Sesamum radiatum]|uniref:Uncharacterized protein n=1 Tax=Sesamum radiatum TaxID=300843 RepID=A0AAW2NMJ0_SESRA